MRARALTPDEHFDLTDYLRRRERYLGPPRVILAVLAALAVIALLALVGTIAAIFVLEALKLETVAALVFLASAIPMAWGILSAVILLVVIIAVSYRRAINEFLPLYLLPGIAAFSAITLFYNGGAVGVAVVIAIHLVVAGYAQLGRSYLQRDAAGRLLARAPRSVLADALRRYRTSPAATWWPLLRFVLRTLQFALVVVLLVGVLLIATLLSQAASIVLWLLTIIFVRPFLARMAGRAFRELRLGTSRSAADLLERDRRPGILFLRSFADDGVLVKRTRSLVEFALGVRKSAPLRLEEALVDVAFRYGPVAALRNPNAPLADHLGAARDVSTNEAWQDYVLNKLRSVDDVILIAGRSEGLRWEIETVEAHDLVNKLIVVIPPGDEWTPELIRSHLPAGIEAPSGERKPLLLFRVDGITVSVTSTSQSRLAYEEAILLAFQRRRTRTAQL